MTQLFLILNSSFFLEHAGRCSQGYGKTRNEENPKCENAPRSERS
jgi:hypothetical protein